MSDVRAISVRGGSAGIEAHCEELLVLARRLGVMAGETAEQSLALHAYLLHPAVIASALLDPVGAADFELSLLSALEGAAGLSWRAVDSGGLDLLLRGAALTYLAADRLEQQVGPSVRGLLDVPPALVQAAPRLLDGDPVGAADALVAGDPELADLAVNAVTGFWSDCALIHTIAAWPDGRARVTALGVAAAQAPPRTLTAVLAGLARRNHGPGSEIDVRIIAPPTGRLGVGRRVIVDIPGTKTWSVSPAESDVTSGGTDLRAVTGARTSYQAGVLEALRSAGVTAADEVLLVGHSQGGLVAVNAAAETARTGEFRITHVVTAGAPIARLAVPRSVQVLAIENDGDVVAHADGAGNPDRTNITTVVLHRRQGDLAANHSLDESYLPGAADIEAATDESVRTYLAGLRPFLGGDTVTTEVFRVERR